MKYPGEITQRLPAWLKEKRPRSEDLIRHREYNRCVVCEERPAITSDVMWVKVEKVKEARFRKWWTCLKCEEGSK